MQKTSIHSPCMRRIRALMEDGQERDGHEICAAAHLSFNTFMNQYRHYLIEAGKLHIVRYKHGVSGPFVPVYLTGPGDGTAPPKPKKIDQLARSRNWKARTGYLEAQKAIRAMRRPLVAKDATLSALLGVRRPPRHTATHSEDMNHV